MPFGRGYARNIAQTVEATKRVVPGDRRKLDECVLELLGVVDKKQRQKLLDELYRETAEYYRYQRTQDIQAMENRSGKKGRRLGPQDLADSIWHSLPDAEKGPPVAEWIKSFCRDTDMIEIPEGKPEALGAGDMFNPTGVTFKDNKESHQISYASSEQAALVAELAKIDIRGRVAVPKSASTCARCLEQLLARLREAEERFAQLAASRTGTQSLQEKTVTLLMHWYAHGKSS